MEGIQYTTLKTFNFPLSNKAISKCFWQNVPRYISITCTSTIPGIFSRTMTEEQRFFGIGDKKSSKASFFYRSGRQVLVNTLYICKFLWFLFFFNLLRESAIRRAARQFFFLGQEGKRLSILCIIISENFSSSFYRTRVLSLAMLVTNSLTD